MCILKSVNMCHCSHFDSFGPVLILPFILFFFFLCFSFPPLKHKIIHYVHTLYTYRHRYFPSSILFFLLLFSFVRSRFYFSSLHHVSKRLCFSFQSSHVLKLSGSSTHFIDLKCIDPRIIFFFFFFFLSNECIYHGFIIKYPNFVSENFSVGFHGEPQATKKNAF